MIEQLDWFKIVYTLLGGIGIFFYGMKVMSESLQSAASDWLRNAIGLYIRNRVAAVLLGLGVTAFVQSSAVMTVMVVGFVNAGLIDLFQAIGLILGANVGTTITGWIFSIQAGESALLLVGLGFIPTLFLKGHKRVIAGKIVFALGLVLFGLELMRQGFMPLRFHEDVISFMANFQSDFYESLYATILLGCVLTMIVRSSAAMIAITMAMASTGIITFEAALALVLGENIGTALIAVFASLNANVNARRAAVARLVVNVAGVIYISILFWPFRGFTEWLISQPANFSTEAGLRPYVATHIAAGHTVFNIINVLVFLPLITRLEKWVCVLVPSKPGKEVKHLELFGSLSTLSAPMAINQVNLELKKMTELVRHMLVDVKTYLFSSEHKTKSADRVKKYEGITDNIQMEITVFLGQVMQAQLTPEDSAEIKKYLRVADELESLADYCLALVRYEERRQRESVIFDAETKKELEILCDKVVVQFEMVDRALQWDSHLTLDEFRMKTLDFNRTADEFKDRHLNRIASKALSPIASLIVSDMAVAMRRLKNHTVNVAEALNEGKKITMIVTAENS